ncbi:uncharacterized protein BXZ73DRAFT_108220 [Epithele typhae]|uniref:uncharacterized protein n=1 Tax=Epithele typhae TaxID=378194 RepID=UPI0020080BF7|nr:uncharacterized protein BXZ73DRAFT_108220 [Epithele typhae]KAH9911144.1 hypothetical protein BXZ73DRAFT_108220 [Epithele typhae]
MYYAGPRRPMNVYYPRPVSPVISVSPMYSPGSHAGSYYDHSPEMRMVPVYRQYSQPMPQPAMVYHTPPLYHNRTLRPYGRSCCDGLCCDRCCDECCGARVASERWDILVVGVCVHRRSLAAVRPGLPSSFPPVFLLFSFVKARKHLFVPSA